MVVALVNTGRRKARRRPRPGLPRLAARTRPDRPERRVRNRRKRTQAATERLQRRWRKAWHYARSSRAATQHRSALPRVPDSTSLSGEDVWQTPSSRRTRHRRNGLVADYGAELSGRQLRLRPHTQRNLRVAPLKRVLAATSRRQRPPATRSSTRCHPTHGCSSTPMTPCYPR